ncbi:MAG: hypothetical protein ACHQT7_01745 [Candidatus Levyibacteriota bacterium]
MAMNYMESGRRPSESPVLPGGAICLPDLTIGGKTPEQLRKLLYSINGIFVGNYASEMLRRKDFATFNKPQTITPVKATFSAMGLTDYQTLEEILARADELGWDKIPAEAAVYMAIGMKNKPLGERIFMGMKPIGDVVFRLGLSGDGQWLSSHVAGWFYDSEGEFVFSLRK